MALRAGRRRRLISRRTFIRLMLATGVAGGVVVDEYLSKPLGLVKWFTVTGRRVSRGFGPNTSVAIVNASYEGDIASALRDAWEAIGTSSLVGRRVVILPHLLYNVPNQEINTNPLVLAAVVRIVREKGASDITVGVAPPHHRDITELLYQGEGGGLLPTLQKLNVPLVDLNYDDIVKRPVKGGYSGRSYVWLPKTVVEADTIITVPKMKTDAWLGVSLSLVNLTQMLPGVFYGWPKSSFTQGGPEQNLIDLYETLPPQLAIVDGIVGMDGDGPIFGRNRATQVLVVGSDLVAVDATCARIMNFEPSKDNKLRHIWLANWLGQGFMDADKISQKGLPLQAVKQNYDPATPIDLSALRF